MRIVKIILDKLKLLALAAVIVAALAGIGWYIVTADLREIERKNKSDPVYQKVMAEVADKEKAEKASREKQDKIEKKKQAEEKAVADFEKSVGGKYTKEDILEVIPRDIKLADRLCKMGGYDCMNYWCASHNWDDELCYDELSYYIFKNERCAKKAFVAIKDSWIDRETDSGKNFVQGWEADVFDAEVEVFIYQIDNMIITTELQVVSGWSEPGDGEDGNSTVGFYYRKDFIRENF